jgi:hypothetical protein
MIAWFGVLGSIVPNNYEKVFLGIRCLRLLVILTIFNLKQREPTSMEVGENGI